MSEDTNSASPSQTREQQIESVLPRALKMAPSVVALAKAYNDAYPPDKTPVEVLNAVTVPVPLTVFMVMASLMINLLAIRQERQKGGV